MKRRQITLFLHLLLIFICLSILTTTDAYYSVYLLFGIIGSVSAYINFKKTPRLTWLEYTFSTIFAIFITMANYPIFTHVSGFNDFWQIIISIILALLILAGSFSIFINILPVSKSIVIKSLPKPLKHNQTVKIFFSYFAIFFFVNLIIFLLCYYPGNLTSDSIDEVGQLLTNSYNNHHPFYFTLLIKFFVSAGIDLFNNINVGIALFNTFQIVILSSAFAYSFLTLRQIGVSKKITLTTSILLAIMPYNIIYSFTAWKDVLFAAFFLIFIVALYRYFNKITIHKKLLFSIIGLSGIIICLFRSNAWAAFTAATILFFFVFKKQHLKLGITLCTIVFMSFLLKNPILKIINVPQPDILESLSIPTQQIARVLVETKNNLSEDDLNLINQLADDSQIVEAYTPYIHDPIKKVIRSNGTTNFLSEHKAEFIALYLKLGLTHPAQYLKAWIDQTKGYWNAGYSYWRWADEISDNHYSIERSVFSTKIKGIFSLYAQLYEETSFLAPTISIGMAVWLLIILFYLNLVKKRSSNILIVFFLLAVWGTLLIATPVFSEFRYIYFLFTCLPFLTIITLTTTKRKVPNEKR